MISVVGDIAKGILGVFSSVSAVCCSLNHILVASPSHSNRHQRFSSRWRSDSQIATRVLNHCEALRTFAHPVATCWKAVSPLETRVPDSPERILPLAQRIPTTSERIVPVKNRVLNRSETDSHFETRVLNNDDERHFSTLRRPESHKRRRVRVFA